MVGYKKESFYYLKQKYGIKLIENDDYFFRNNHSTIYAARNYLGNTYICSSDNYFVYNPFEAEVDEPYYAATYADSETNEWCMQVDSSGWIEKVTIGGKGKWYMLGHVFWNKEFSQRFIEILMKEYNKPETYNKFWENIYIEHIDELKLKMRKYPKDYVFEFDSLDELRVFDSHYFIDSKSTIMRRLSEKLKCKEKDLIHIVPEKDINGNIIGFQFDKKEKKYLYIYETEEVKEC